MKYEWNSSLAYTLELKLTVLSNPKTEVQWQEARRALTHDPIPPRAAPQSRREEKRANANSRIDPFVPRTDHNPRELRSWAKRTGFVSTFSSETTSSSNDAATPIPASDLDNKAVDNNNHHRNGGSSPKIEIDPVLGRTKQLNRRIEIEPDSRPGNDDRNLNESKKRIVGNDGLEAIPKKDEVGLNGTGDEPKKGEVNDFDHVGIEVYPGEEALIASEGWNRQSRMRYGLRDNPGFALLMYYGLQHYLSLAGSLIFIPLIIVPAMGGTDRDTAEVISTMLLISGITTILHSYFGTRLPLVQGSSFVYLAPALVIINAREYRNLTEHKFRHIMRELQGAIIVGSLFQSILGFTGFMSLLLRLINPVMVAPTVAAVGLAFFSYGFPQAGSCVEISIPLILLVLIFTLYLRGISIFGHRIFQIYAVPLSVLIIWTYAFFLTAGGAYNYKGCSSDVPSSNILVDACRKHAYTMQHCRTDASNAWRTAAWVRIPYPLQWGVPIFHFRTSLIMIIVSLVATVDSVGTYHSTSLLVNSKPPTPRIVSRGIALEGFCSVLAGIWGSGTGATTLTENVHTVNITKVASRRVVETGAAFLILFSFIGKVGAILASIPQALAASMLCFMWGLTVSLGLSTLQYSQTSSYRNITIVGVSLFLGLTIPAYFQQYQPESSLILPSYFVPYAAASNGPVHTSSKQFDFAMNALMSLNMVVTLVVAFVLDNTVPGSRQERGVYIWSHAEEMATDPSLHADYSLPSKISRFFC
ncbi:XANTHINE-URACIL / VITAMIN C PERMEASE FAMILY MEMBER [Salix koriyanagi]|uniref:XANTHINE-URACIL / VITAMIN C PERMEASE FAMILY MEMBER n=2 Tax=Salix TaxID=40685 RepID=A0A9Q0UMT6_9ROSI|nr:XANTHINE-URACIL / VITAMIN C PERMEASE FAMILY MEMBER [Salix koriyanagi]